MKVILLAALIGWPTDEDQPKPPTPETKPTTASQGTDKAPPKVTLAKEQRQSVSQRLIANMERARARAQWNSSPNYRVSIRTVGGRKFSGIVVRNEEFQGLVESGQIATDRLSLRPGSFELSYVDGLDGHVVLPWSLIKSVRVTEVLDGMKLQELDVDLVRARSLRSDQRREQLLARAESALEEAAAEEAEKAEQEAEVREANSQGTNPESDLPLLTEFPPADGWGEDRKKQIEWRQTIMGVFPSEQEQSFLDNYEAWLGQYTAFMMMQVQPEEEVPVAEEDVDFHDEPASPAPTDEPVTQLKQSDVVPPNAPVPAATTRRSAPVVSTPRPKIREQQGAKPLRR